MSADLVLNTMRNTSIFCFRTLALLAGLLMGCLLSVYAADFIVTNNADSGPGTLRDALLRASANGTSEQDRILFNLPGGSLEARTILLDSELPDVTSNVIIDGTSQPGDPFGASDAKVRIAPRIGVYTNDNAGALSVVNADHVEIYGLYITGFHTLYGQESNNASYYAIQVTRGSAIIIGKPGMGNVFDDNSVHINIQQGQTGTPTGVTVQSNWIGINTNGDENRGNSETMALRITGSDVLFGGASPDQGNRVGAGTRFQLNGFSVENNEFRSGAQLNNSESGVFRDNQLYDDFLQLDNSYQDIGIYGNQNIGWLEIKTNVPPDQVFVEIGTDEAADVNTFTHDGAGITGVAAVRKNSFDCVYYPFWTQATYPTIEVLENSPSVFGGVASPNAEIYIYDDDTDCEITSPVTFFRKTTADANGNWEIRGDFSDRRFTANAVVGNQSSAYTQVGFENKYAEHRDNFILTHPDCEGDNGAIEVINYINTLQIEWYDEEGRLLQSGPEPRIEGLGPGKYTCILRNGNSSMTFENYELHLPEWRFYTEDIRVIAAECGAPVGRVENLRVVSTYYQVATGNHEIIRLQWFDESNNPIGPSGTGGTLPLRDVPPGTYFLRAYISENCYGEYEVTIEGPRADLSAMQVEHVTCDGPGQITGISLSGMEGLEVLWLDERGTEVGEGSDLHDITNGGTYRLALVGDTDCDTIWAAFVDVQEIGIPQFDEQSLEIIPVSCDGVTLGSITGLVVEGAISYEWQDETGQVVGNALELTDVPVGRYRLLVTADEECMALSDWYLVAQEEVVFPEYAVSTEQPSCIGNDGVLEIDWGNETVRPAAWRWLDSNGTEVGSGQRVEGLVPGIYRLMLINEAGCEVPDPREFRLEEAVPLTLNTTAMYVQDVARDSNSGAIGGIAVVGGTAPYTYSWYNAAGELVGNEAELSGIPADVYVLEVVDARACRSLTEPITVNTFNGDDLGIPNTFSPNGDGYNDTWFPAGLERYTRALVRVFDRQGQLVYEGRSTDAPFNGQYRGTNLPVGAYYFLIDLGNEYPALKGSLNLLR